jgi:hypothetical protein
MGLLARISEKGCTFRHHEIRRKFIEKLPSYDLSILDDGQLPKQSPRGIVSSVVLFYGFNSDFANSLQVMSSSNEMKMG